MTFDELCEVVRTRAKERAFRKSTLMRRRIQEIDELYIGRYNEVILKAMMECEALGITESNDAGRVRILELTLAAEGVDIKEQGQLDFEKGKSNDADTVDGDPSQADRPNGGQHRGPHEAAGGPTGSESDKPPADGTVGKARRNRTGATPQ